MQRWLLGLIVLALVAGAFFLGRRSNPPEAGAAQAPVDSAAKQHAESDAGDAGASALSVSASPAARATGPQSGSAPNAGPKRGAAWPSSPVSAQASGPQPLKPGDEPRLDKMERNMDAEGGVTGDLLDLARNEPQDERARQLEALITQSILRNGGDYTQLRLSAPHCTRSVCIMRGIGLQHTQDPRSDWQRLSMAIANEPWFRGAFDDARSMVGGDGPDTVYISLYVRCDPGSCRLGNR